MVLTWLSAPVRPRVIKARARYRRLRSRCRSQSTTVNRPRARKLRLTTACTRCSAAVIETTVPRETQKNDACMGELKLRGPLSGFLQEVMVRTTVIIVAARRGPPGGERGEGRTTDCDRRSAVVSATAERLRWNRTGGPSPPE